VRFRKALTVRALDKSLFEEITRQLKPRAIKVKTGTLVDATIIVSASKEDDEGHWVKHRVGLAKSCWRVWPCQQATDHFVAAQAACRRGRRRLSNADCRNRRLELAQGLYRVNKSPPRAQPATTRRKGPASGCRIDVDRQHNDSKR
jgi:hypothetical protein